jgi:hypothetical protein
LVAIVRNKLDQKLLELGTLLLEVTENVDHLCNVFVHGETIMTLLVADFDVNWVVVAEAIG